MRATHVEHEFVELIPDELPEATIFISIPYATAAHLCLCGCGQRVITPLSPTDWHLVFDGDSVSLAPSIGNWSFECQSHYWIKRNRVDWSTRWSQARIDAGRARDRHAKQKHLGGSETETEDLADRGQVSRKSRWQPRWLERLRSRQN